jgi:tRNA G10  N-methylase Trm11
MLGELENNRVKSYIYTYSYHEDEQSLCGLEMRSLFGFDTISQNIESEIEVDPSRSPFIKERIEIILESRCYKKLLEKLEGLPAARATFKVIFVPNGDEANSEKVKYEERRKLEREIGMRLKGQVDLLSPEQLFGFMRVGERWVFGKLLKGESVWFKHQKKPRSYSTALSTRVARAVVNIAVPNPIGKKVIDPCCGIGTVLVEALSMGIDIVGSDLNPLVLSGARENITYFGYSAEVTRKDIRNLTGNYDVAIIDMPYNLCSVLPKNVQLEMLQSAKRFARKIVVVTVEPIDSIIEEAGYTIIDRCVAKKSQFIREIIVCE